MGEQAAMTKTLEALGARFTCFTGTKVQILTQKGLAEEQRALGMELTESLQRERAELLVLRDICVRIILLRMCPHQLYVSSSAVYMCPHQLYICVLSSSRTLYMCPHRVVVRYICVLIRELVERRVEGVCLCPWVAIHSLARPPRYPPAAPIYVSAYSCIPVRSH